MLERRPLPEPGERWKHYKGEVYEIVGLGNHTENDQHLVAYVRPGGADLKFRPVRMFMSAIGDGETPRFSRIRSVVQFKARPKVIIDQDPGDESQAA